MGGCCCCSSRRAEPSSIPTYYYFPGALDEQEPLSAHPNRFSTGLVVNTNLETSIPDSYTPPPPPVPFDVDLGHPLTSPRAIEDTNRTKPDSSIELADADRVGKINDDGSRGCAKKDLKETGGEQSDPERASSVDLDLEEIKKANESIILVVEECPICLEDYDEENPKMLTKCGHHFHLACILEWTERSENCPVCDQETDMC